VQYTKGNVSQTNSKLGPPGEKKKRTGDKKNRVHTPNTGGVLGGIELRLEKRDRRSVINEGGMQKGERFPCRRDVPFPGSAKKI